MAPRNRRSGPPPPAQPLREEILLDGRVHLFLGGALEAMERLPDAAVDLVLTDLPYGTTACAWDFIIPPADMWKGLKRVAKPHAAFVFTAVQPFTWALCASNPKDFRYALVWEKPNGTNPYQARFMPMKRHEDILVFYARQPTYNPQMTEGRPYAWNSRRSGGEAGGVRQIRETPIDNPGTRYPTSILRFPQERGLHPTQKPVPLMEWLIRSYSNPGDTILDITMGSGTTGVAAIRSGRRFIGAELSPEYHAVAKQRILQASS